MVDLERAAALRDAAAEAAGCVRCPLAEGRTQVVFGEGNADAELVLVGEAPGFHEDREGVPFAGRARELLERLLGSVGLSLDDAYLATVLKCRPPGNRDPLPAEIEACQAYLLRQVELIQPKVICTLGNFATKLLRGDPATGITRLHGREEIRVIGTRAVRLFPLFHPAAALYTPAMLQTLKGDFARIPELLALEAPEQPAPAEAHDAVVEAEVAEAVAAPAPAEPAALALEAAEPEEAEPEAPAADEPEAEPEALAAGEPEEAEAEAKPALEPDAEVQLGLF
jgi:DNA polymerase